MAKFLFSFIILTLAAPQITAQELSQPLFSTNLNFFEQNEPTSLLEFNKSKNSSNLTPQIPEFNLKKSLGTRQFYFKDQFSGQFMLFENQGDGAYLKHQTLDYFTLPLGCHISSPQGDANAGDFGGAILHALFRELDLGLKFGRHTITFF